MSHFNLNTKLKTTYDGYYDGTSYWREIGAIDKAANIIRLCDSYKPQRILEIGAGEGAILKRLDELRFGEELYAAEISSSGVSSQSIG